MSGQLRLSANIIDLLRGHLYSLIKSGVSGISPLVQTEESLSLPFISYISQKCFMHFCTFISLTYRFENIIGRQWYDELNRHCITLYDMSLYFTMATMLAWDECIRFGTQHRAATACLLIHTHHPSKLMRCIICFLMLPYLFPCLNANENTTTNFFQSSHHLTLWW